MKRCSKCRESLPLHCFGKNSHSADGLRSECKSCRKAIQAKYYQENKAAIRTQQSTWVQANPDYAKNYYQQNQGRQKLNAKQWAKAHPDKRARAQAVRKAAKVSQVHPDHDPAKERELFERAKELEQATGEKWHVDHVLPLNKGGWHHHSNLQILPAKVNLQKGDSLEWSHPDYLSWRDLPKWLIPLALAQEVGQG